MLVGSLQAGDASVKVEYRGGAEERFGRGLERTMKFGDFVGELERKNDLLYLTTQVRETHRQIDTDRDAERKRQAESGRGEEKIRRRRGREKGLCVDPGNEGRNELVPGYSCSASLVCFYTPRLTCVRCFSVALLCSCWACVRVWKGHSLPSSPFVAGEVPAF